MALSTATISYDFADILGVDFDERRTKVYVTTNVPGGTVIDTVGNKIRVGDGKGTVAADGTGSVAVWVPGTGSNPASWQTYITFDYSPRAGRTPSDRKLRVFGPFTITADANLADLIEEQEVPPEYATTLINTLSDYADEAAASAFNSSLFAQQAEDARDAAVDISNIEVSDDVIAAAMKNTGGGGPKSSAALEAAAAVPLSKFATPGATGDQTTAIQGALQAIYDAGGGTLTVDGYYRADGQLVIPHDNATPYPLGRSLRITGKDGSSTLTGGQRGKSILDLRYSGSGAKIVALGQAMFEMDHFSLEDRGTSSTPFVLVTQAVPRFHHMSVIGNTSKYGIQCDQDAFILGGTLASYDNTQLSGFAGYGGSITENQFAHIRRAVFMRVFCNSVVVAGNWNQETCGSNLTGGACYEIDAAVSSGPAGFAIGNVIRENVIEQTNYPYGVKVKASGNAVLDNGFYDEQTGYIADVRIEASGNEYRPLVRGTVPLSESTAGMTKVLDNREGILSGGWTFQADGSSVPLAVKGRSGQSVNLFEWRDSSGNVYGRINPAGSVRLGAVGDDFSIKVDHDSWATPAGYFVNAKGFGVLLGPAGSLAQLGLTDGSGVALAFVKAAAGSPEGVFAAPVGSLYLRTDGSTSTTLYVKTSGTGNTGWTAK